MSRILYRVGSAAAAHSWRTIAGWLAVLVAALALATTVGGTTHDNFNVDGTSSQRGTELLQASFPALSGTDARVVVHGTGLTPTLLSSLGRDLAGVENVGTVSPPRLSADGDTALFSLTYEVPVTDYRGSEGLDVLREATSSAVGAGLQVDFGGQLAEQVNSAGGTAEAVGIVAALIILLLAFRSVVAAGLPVAVAFVGLLVGTASITVLAGSPRSARPHRRWPRWSGWVSVSITHCCS